MGMSNLATRLEGRFQRTTGNWLFRRTLPMRNPQPCISFTFDDFPASALYAGGAILEAHGARGTYYAAFGLAGTTGPTGTIFVEADVPRLLERGHELACHTYAHCDSWSTGAAQFDASLEQNAQALRKFGDERRFRSFSYPISSPHPLVKRVAGRRFESCRAGGQVFNAGQIDLNLLSSYFIEKSVAQPERMREIIAANAAANGWLIFSTHDVAAQPTRFGCTPELFEQIVRWSVESGACILPVAEALERVRGG
jgi:peptidoglycan/xylan/chitin deacetylase (PgdA/CDA1 family)